MREGIIDIGFVWREEGDLNFKEREGNESYFVRNGILITPKGESLYIITSWSNRILFSGKIKTIEELQFLLKRIKFLK